MDLRTANDMVSRQAYVNLNKASWILTDVIDFHPQRSYVESPVRYDVMNLTEVCPIIFAPYRPMESK
jgi:hypothetical protein